MYFHKMKKYSDVLKGNPKLIQAMLVEYVQSKKEKVRAQSIGSQLTALRHFFWINHRNKDTEWDWVRHFIGEASKAVEDKPYTHVQIKAMLNVAKPRIKIAIYSEAQGGPRGGAIPIIKKGDLSRTPHGFYRVVLYRGTPAVYVSFFGLEATKEIDDYFAYRERAGEVLTAASPLIREEFKATDKFGAQHPRFISKRTLERQIGYVAVAAGIRTVEKGGGPHKRKENMLTHGLRKFFEAAMQAGGCRSHSN